MNRPSLALAGLALAVWAFPGMSAESVPAPSRAAGSGYVSAFTDYRPFREDALRPWPAANEQMGRLGGHGGHAQGEPANPPPAAAPAQAGESQPWRSGEREPR